MGGDLLAQPYTFGGRTQDLKYSLMHLTHEVYKAWVRCIRAGWDKGRREGGRYKNPASGMTLGGRDLVAYARAPQSSAAGAGGGLELTMDSLMRSNRRASSMLSFGQ